MQEQLMTLKVLLPFEVFAEIPDVSRIVSETREGSFGLLPRRLDCVAALAPGILVYETKAGGEAFIAVDEGVLVKTGTDVLVSVRRASAGDDLGTLHAFVQKKFVTTGERDRETRSVSAKLEAQFLRRFATYQND